MQMVQKGGLMSEKTYVINIKTKAGTIFTVRADSAKELDENIKDVIDNDIAGSITGLESIITSTPVTDAVSILQDTLGATVINEAPVAGFAPVPPPQTNTASQVGTRTCNHGSMIGRKGTGAKGEWKGLFCPTPKGTSDQCQPIWLKRTDTEWASI
jgi:hypothetical protein